MRYTLIILLIVLYPGASLAYDYGAKSYERRPNMKYHAKHYPYRPSTPHYDDAYAKPEHQMQLNQNAY